jgi:hypothetical protein
MNEFGLFMEKFLGRYLRLVGLKSFRLPSFSVESSSVVAVFTILVVIVGTVFSTNFEKSRLRLGYSSTLANNFLQTAKLAAEGNDFFLAEQLYDMGVNGLNADKTVLGSQSQIEEVVFPEISLESKLFEIENLLEKQPLHRDLLIQKTLILYQLRLKDEAKKTFEKLLMVDPNNKTVIEMKVIFEG